MLVVKSQFKYGNWIRKKTLLWLGLSALAMAVFATFPLPPYLRILAALLSFILFVSFLYPLYAYIVFSPQGGNLQDKVYTLIIRNLHPYPKEKALDIGSGNGVLTVKLAQHFPAISVIGIDYWGKDWEYSRRICEENAALANISNRVHFFKGDAASLDFGDESFDAVVSNLTFHEVKSAPQKDLVVKEALRVLKPGGSFAFVDYFYESRYYGSSLAFKDFLQGLNLAEVTLKPISEMMPIPALLRHARIFGRVGLLYGQK
jgi:SAM-dependent methyltransferase